MRLPSKPAIGSEGAAMSGVILREIYCSYSLEPVGYKGINKSSKTDARKQARKTDNGNPPPDRRIRAQLYKKKEGGDSLSGASSLQVRIGVTCYK